MKLRHWLFVFGLMLSVALLTPATAEAQKKFTPPKSPKQATQKLVGTWTLTAPEVDEAKAKKLFPQGAPPELVEKALKQMKEMLSKMSVTMALNKDGTSKSEMKMPGPDGKPMEKTETGKWEVTKVDGKNITLKTTEEKDGKTKSENLKITFLSNDSFQIIGGPGIDKAPIKFVLKRKK